MLGRRRLLRSGAPKSQPCTRVTCGTESSSTMSFFDSLQVLPATLTCFGLLEVSPGFDSLEVLPAAMSCFDLSEV